MPVRTPRIPAPGPAPSPLADPGPELALRIESGDAPAGTTTPQVMAVGDSFQGMIGYAGDHDWIRVRLQPGSYMITLEGVGMNALPDPWLRVHSASGTLIAQNDDRADLDYDSALVLNVTSAGTYLLDAAGYEDATGTYALNISRAATGLDALAGQLTDGYWESRGLARRAFDVAPGGVLQVDMSGLTAEGRHLAAAALRAWTDASGIRFDTTPAAGRTPDIVIDDEASGASTSSTVIGSELVGSQVNIGQDWLATYGTSLNSYSYQTFIHELGHALGLGHAGNYNGSATWGQDNLFPDDSWQATIMSYFDQEQNTVVDASRAFAISPMMADIIAIRDLYGPARLRTGNDIYGENSNLGGNYGVISRLLAGGARDDVTFTITDQGGIDRLDLSGDSHDQRISLAPGAISDAYGLRGNISILRDTVIENLSAGAGDDRLAGNPAANAISGNGGDDRISGGAGNDTLRGGAGHDTLAGGAGNDLYHADRLDVITEESGAGRDRVMALSSLTLAANIEDLTLARDAARNATGNGLANALAGNGMANILHGLQGADRLVGGAGNDTLAGDRGDDVLNGGAGADVFIFALGHDVIRDFGDNIDTVRIDDALWGGAERSAGWVLDHGRLVDGEVVLSFGDHSLTFENLTRIAALQDDLVIV